jgi:hypothetical protein
MIIGAILSETRKFSKSTVFVLYKLINGKWAILQLYHGANKLHFNEMMLMLALY